MPERIGAALLHWVNPPEIRPFYYSSSVTTPVNVEGLVAMWQAAQAKAIGAAALAGAAAAQALLAGLAQKEAAIRQTEQFRTTYEPFGAQFAMVQIADLVAPQVWADTTYAYDLGAALPANGDEEALFDYCFAQGRLEPPMMIGINGAVIVSGRRSLGTVSPLRLESADDHKATFGFDALPRPNWLLLNVIPQTGQLLVVNGVHHVLGLMSGGRDHAYCLVTARPVDQLFDFRQDPGGLFRFDRLTADRPPLVRDYLDPAVADAVGLRAVDQFMRFGVQNPPEIGFVPQSD